MENWHPSEGELPYMNVGTGIDLTIRELAESVAACIGFKGEIIWNTSKPDGTPKKQLNTARLRRIGWSASIELKEGLKSTVDNYRDHIDEPRCSE